MVYTTLRCTCSLCRERAGHEVLHQESEKVHPSPGWAGMEPRGTFFIQTPTSDEYLRLLLMIALIRAGHCAESTHPNSLSRHHIFIT